MNLFYLNISQTSDGEVSGNLRQQKEDCLRWSLLNRRWWACFLGDVTTHYIVEGHPCSKSQIDAQVYVNREHLASSSRWCKQRRCSQITQAHRGQHTSHPPSQHAQGTSAYSSLSRRQILSLVETRGDLEWLVIHLEDSYTEGECVLFSSIGRNSKVRQN